jgi:hypothetical protein
MDKGVDTPLIEDQDRQKKFITAIRGTYLGILCIILILENSLATFMENERRLGSLVVLLYTTHYFSCRAKGDNFLIQLWGIKPPTKGSLLASDLVATVLYILCLGILIFQL